MLKGRKFVVLPNEETPRRRYMRTLIEKNGGDNGYQVGLVDDSFVSGGHVTKHKLFYAELNPKNVPLERLQLFKLSDLTKWLKYKYVDLSQPLQLYEEIVVDEEGDDSQESNNGSRQVIVEQKREAQNDVGKTEPNTIPNSSNPNSQLIKVLRQLEKRYKLQNDIFRSLGYQKAIKKLQTVQDKIETEDDALRNGLSAGLSRKVPMLLQLSAGRGSELNMDLKEQTQRYFQQCHGIGVFTSQQFVNMGYTSFQDLVPFMNWVQLTGLAFYEDWQLPIPREETKKHESVIRDAISEVSPELQMEITGSYRRGSRTSGDIDIVVHIPGQDDLDYVSAQLQKVIVKLVESGYIICPLNLNETLKEAFEPWFRQLFSHFDKRFDVKTYDEAVHKFYCGAAVDMMGEQEGEQEGESRHVIPFKSQDLRYKMSVGGGKVCRRVDFLISGYSGLGATKLYFTGNDDFNKKCRTVAKQRGFVLRNDGLYREGQLIPLGDEYEVLDMLGIERLEPEQRNI
ncbi:DNA polymerase IV [Kluyveromyces marxianus]|uniref:DNA polymerase n=1 Tax=Kluyveromyces marxianus TaxID=4911 RepID=A0ABX6EPR1_KLUMA|nr:DNA polymerase IV [Kluyveromyces marxianus]